MDNESTGKDVASKVVSEVLKEGAQANKTLAEAPGKAADSVTKPARNKVADKVAKMAEEQIRQLAGQKSGKKEPNLDSEKNAPLAKGDDPVPAGPEKGETITIDKKELEQMIDEAVSKRLKDLTPQDLIKGLEQTLEEKREGFVRTVNKVIDDAQKNFNDLVDRTQRQVPVDRGQTLPGPENRPVNEDREEKFIRSLSSEQLEKLRGLLDKAEGKKLPEAAEAAKENITGRFMEKGQDAVKDKAKEAAAKAAEKTAEKAAVKGAETAAAPATGGLSIAIGAGVKAGKAAGKIVVDLSKGSAIKETAAPAGRAVRSVTEKSEKKERQENPFRDAADTVKNAQKTAKELGITK